MLCLQLDTLSHLRTNWLQKYTKITKVFAKILADIFAKINKCRLFLPLFTKKGKTCHQNVKFSQVKDNSKCASQVGKIICFGKHVQNKRLD